MINSFNFNPPVKAYLERERPKQDLAAQQKKMEQKRVEMEQEKERKIKELETLKEQKLKEKEEEKALRDQKLKEKEEEKARKRDERERVKSLFILKLDHNIIISYFEASVSRRSQSC